MAHLDRAYCHQTDSVLTIYQVRDLHFDEGNDFNAKIATYECPDEDCSVELRGVKHAAVEFKNAPHFRVLKNHDHGPECDFRKGKTSKPDKDTGVGDPRDYKDSTFPSELLLERQPLPYGTGKPKKPRGPRSKPQVISGADEDYAAPHRTSILEHIVETWLAHGKDVLRRELLTIGDMTKYYPNMFKPIEYFTNGRGFIYWGAVKEIRYYRHKDAYSITFVDKPWFDGEPRQIGIYIESDQIERYRRRRLFRRYMDSLLNATQGSVNCYFVGAYPELKSEDVVIKTGVGEKRFRPLEVHLSNLDHLVLRFDKDEEVIENE